MPGTRPSRLATAVSVLACLAVTAAFALPTVYLCQKVGARTVCAWDFTRNGGTDDWRYFVGVWEAARVAISTFHQFPSWNPYHCGGIVLYQDPQAPFPGPLFLLTFAWLPAAAGMKVWVLVHLVAGALGARGVVHRAGGNLPEQVLAATLVTACGFCSEHFGGGHLSFTPFLLFPWVLYAHRRALSDDPRWAILVAALFALCVYEGATYPLPLMAVGLGVDVLCRVGDADDRRAMALSLPLVGLLFPLLSAARLLPILKYLHEHPRLVPLDDRMTVAEVLECWLTGDHDRVYPGHVYVWPEYGDYVGVVPVALIVGAVIAAIVQRDAKTRDRRIDLALLVGMIWCALGNIPGFSLFGVLHQLPLYKSLRVPSRFLYPATVAGALLAARGLSDIRAWMASAGLRTALQRSFVVIELALAVGVAWDLCATNSPHLQVPPDEEVPRVPAMANFYQEAVVDYSRWPTHPVRGIGTPVCYVPLDWGPSPGLWVGRGRQYRIVPENAGRAIQTRWTPNAVTFMVDLARPAALVVNQNAESSWETSEGTIDRVQTLLTVRLPAGQRTVTVRHRPAGLVEGVVASLFGAVLAVMAAWGLTPKRVAVLRNAVQKYATGRKERIVDRQARG